MRICNVPLCPPSFPLSSELNRLSSFSAERNLCLMLGCNHRKVHRNNQVQYQPRIMEAGDARAILSSNGMGDFLAFAKPK